MQHEIRVKQVRTFSDLAGDQNKKRYIAFVNIHDLPCNLNIKTNPRKFKATSVYKQIEESLLNDYDLLFQELNRGLLITAHSVRYNKNRQNGEETLTLNFTDLNVHGLVDGNHTYQTICRNRNEMVGDERYVMLDILVGADSYFTELAKARNTSLQVKDNSIAELEHRFDTLKDALVGTPLENNIAWSEHDTESVSCADIISLLAMFNPDESRPITKAYGSPGKVKSDYIKQLKNGNDPFTKIYPIVSDIIDIANHIEGNFASVYNDDGGRFRGLNEVRTKASGYGKYFDPNTNIDHRVPKGYLYPMIGAFRSLLVENAAGDYEFIRNPIEVFDALGKQMVGALMEVREEEKNPTKTGKKKYVWNTLAMFVETYVALNR